MAMAGLGCVKAKKPVQTTKEYYEDNNLSTHPLIFKEETTRHTANKNISLESATSGDWRYKTSRGFYLGNDFAIGQYGRAAMQVDTIARSEEHTSELQSRGHLVCRLLLEKKNTNNYIITRQ